MGPKIQPMQAIFSGLYLKILIHSATLVLDIIVSCTDHHSGYNLEYIAKSLFLSQFLMQCLLTSTVRSLDYTVLLSIGQSFFMCQATGGANQGLGI